MAVTTISMFEPADVAWRMHPSKLSVVKAVGRRMVPYLIEATLIPTALFYVFFIIVDLKWAIIAALGWTYAAVGRRIVTGRPIPACWCSPRWGSPCAPSSSYSAGTISCTSSSRSCAPSHRDVLRPVGARRPAAHHPICRRLLSPQP